MFKKVFPFCVFILLTVFMSIAYPASPYDEIYTEYPKNKYLIGIGEVNKTNNTIQDKRIAEVLARLEIAKQIKVRLREETLDIMCEGSFERLFKDALKCRNEFIMIIEVTVDEFLRGSKIVTHGEKDGIVYAVAVMPRTQAVVELDKNIQKSINKTREEIEKAKQGDSESIEEAEKEFMKAVTYNKERELIEGVKGHASEIFEELEKELVKLKRGQGK